MASAAVAGSGLWLRLAGKAARHFSGKQLRLRNREGRARSCSHLGRPNRCPSAWPRCLAQAPLQPKGSAVPGAGRRSASPSRWRAPCPVLCPAVTGRCEASLEGLGSQAQWLAQSERPREGTCPRICCGQTSGKVSTAQTHSEGGRTTRICPGSDSAGGVTFWRLKSPRLRPSILSPPLQSAKRG